MLMDSKVQGASNSQSSRGAISQQCLELHSGKMMATSSLLVLKEILKLL